MKRLKAFFAKIAGALKGIDGDRMATLSMRWARPIFFMLTTIMLVVAWWYPERLDIYFTALSKAPEWVTNILTILILGLAVEKGVVRPLKELMTTIKGQ